MTTTPDNPAADATESKGDEDIAARRKRLRKAHPEPGDVPDSDIERTGGNENRVRPSVGFRTERAVRDAIIAVSGAFVHVGTSLGKYESAQTACAVVFGERLSLIERAPGAHFGERLGRVLDAGLKALGLTSPPKDPAP